MKEPLLWGREDKSRSKRGKVIWEGLMMMSKNKVEKLKNTVTVRSSRMNLWMIRATTSVILWICIVQLTAFGDMWGPRVLKGWPSCFTQESAIVEFPTALPRVLPPKS